MRPWYSILPPAGDSLAVLRVHDDIGCGASAADCLRELEGFARVDLLVSTCGGDAATSLDLLEALTGRCERAIATGPCYSGGVIVLQAGRRRYAARGATLMVHEGRSAVVGTADRLEAEAIRLRAANEKFIELYCRRTGQPREIVMRWMTADTFFGPAEAVAANLVDEIVEDAPAPASRPLPPVIAEDEGQTLLSVLAAIGQVHCADPARVRREVMGWVGMNLR